MLQKNISKTFMEKITSQVSDSLINKVFYDSNEWKFLETGANSKSFLQDVSDIVNCGNLYTLKRTCYYDNQNEYCPVQLIIEDQRLKQYYNGNVLLQVWNKQGVKVYEQVFQVNDIAFYNNLLMLCAESYIKVIDLLSFDLDQRISNSNENEREIVIDDIGDNLISEIDLEYQNKAVYEKKSYIMQGLFLINKKIVMALEAEDNQIDFSYLEILSRYSKEGETAFEYQIKQINEILKRQVRYDPILKFDFVIKDGRMFGISMRRSRNIDLYRDLMKVETSLIHASQIAQGFQQCYILLQKDGGCKEISTENERYSYSLCKDSTFTNQVIFNRCVNNINLFNSIIALNQNIFIAHGRILSIYNIYNKQWVDHFLQENDITSIFKIKSQKQIYKIGIILKDGIFKILKSDDHIYYEIWQFASESCNQHDQKLEQIQRKQSYELPKIQGEILKMLDDVDDQYLIILSKISENQFKFQSFFKQKLMDINLIDIDIFQLVDYQCFIPIQGTDKLLLGCTKNSSKFDIFQITIDNKQISLRLKETKQISQKLQCDLNQVHTVLTQDLDQMICLVDKTYIEIMEFKTQEQYFFEAYILKLVLSDQSFMYCFTQDKTTNRCNFSIIDLHGTIQTNQLAKFDLYTLELNEHNSIDYDKYNNRFIYFFAFGEVYITPPLHRNNFDFFGMAQRDIYVSFKQIKDRFMALDKNNSITSWSSVTGKKYSVNKCTEDFGNYDIFCPEIYTKSYYTKVLMINKIEEKDFNESSFFEKNGFQYISTLKNQVTFNQALGKRFHQFKLIEINDESNVTVHLEFIHPKYDTQQYLFFNRNNSIMLEIIKGQYSVKALLYERNNIRDKQVEWKIIRQLDNFPGELLDVSLYPFYFSPEFTYYLDYDPLTKNFIVRHSMTQIDMHIIPKDVINDDEDLRTKAKKLLFYDEGEIIVISKEGGDEAIEKKVSINDNFKDISSQVIPYFKGSKDHYFVDPDIHNKLNVLKRLQDKYINLRRTMYVHRKRDKTSVYETLFSVAIVDENKQATCKPYIDMSFTYLDWNVIEKLASNEITIDKVSEKQLTQVIFNILPNCETVLHKVWQNSEVLTILLSLSLSKDRQLTIMDTPFLQNLDGKSPLHLCVDKGDQKSINIILNELSVAHFNHHSQEIIDIIPELVKNPTPALLDYFDRRFVQTYWTQNQKRGALRIPDSQEQCVMPSDPWVWESIYSQKLLNQDEADLPIQVQFLDLPKLHSYQEEVSVQFFNALSESENLEIFQKQSIKSLIEFKYSLAKEYTIKKLMLPYMLFLLVYCMYANTINPRRNESIEYNNLDRIMKIVLLIMSSYFLKNELTQFYLIGFEYFNSFWNYIDSFPPMFIILMIILEILNIHSEIEIAIQAIVALFMWLKFLYFFRVFQKTGYLILMIVNVIVDMVPFLTVLTISIIAFGNAFLIISLSNTYSEDPEYDKQFVKGLLESVIFTYRIGLGDWDTGNFGENYLFLVWFLFIVATIFNLVVMFNLLIAIISETFNKVNENSEAFMYQVMSNIIAENAYLIPEYKREEHCEQNKYMLFAMNIKEDKQKEDLIQQRFVEIKSLMNDHGDQMKNIIESINNPQKKEESKFNRSQSGIFSNSQRASRKASAIMKFKFPKVNNE